MQLELKNKSINVHPIGHKKVSEHRIVAKHGAKVEKNYKVWKYLEQISAYFQNNILEISCIVCIDHDIFQKEFAMLLEMEQNCL